jgi:hypothetical protein
MESVMPKFNVMAQETVYYMIEVEAESAQAIRDDFEEGELNFDSTDIVDGEDLNLLSVEPVDN